MLLLGNKSFNGSEDDLVKMFIDQHIGYGFNFGDNFDSVVFYEQVSTKFINRRSDLIAKCGKRLINIEFKLNDWRCVIKQADDHLYWCDYSYVCVPADLLTYVPFRFVEILKMKGIGLIIATHDTFIEIVKGHYNPYTAKKQKVYRNIIISKLNGIDRKRSLSFKKINKK